MLKAKYRVRYRLLNNKFKYNLENLKMCVWASMFQLIDCVLRRYFTLVCEYVTCYIRCLMNKISKIKYFKRKMLIK